MVMESSEGSYVLVVSGKGAERWGAIVACLQIEQREGRLGDFEMFLMWIFLVEPMIPALYLRLQ